MSASKSRMNIPRWSGLAGIIGGLLWGILWTLQTFVHGPTQAGLGSGVYGPYLFLPWSLFVISWMGIYVEWRPQFRKLALAGYAVTLIALVMVGAGLFLVEVLGISDAYIPLFAMGLLSLGVGLFLFGVAILQSVIWPRWIGVVLIIMSVTPFALALSWPIRGAEFGDFVGYASLIAPELLFGVGWLLIGYFIGFSKHRPIPSMNRSGT